MHVYVFQSTEVIIFLDAQIGPIFGQLKLLCPFDMTPVAFTGFLAELTRHSLLF